MKAVLYVRISELTDSTTSPERQEAECRGFAERQGLEVLGVFRDLDISAFSGAPRPGLENALQAIEEGDATHLVAWRIDRLARSIVAFHGIIDRVQDAGGSVVSVSESLDFSTPAGKMVASILATFAEFESATISARVKSVRSHLKTEGLHVGRRPFGWSIEPHESGKGYVLSPDPAELPVLIELAERYVNKEGTGALARELNARGISTAYGGKWSRTTVRQTLARPQLAEHLDPSLRAQLAVALAESARPGRTRGKNPHASWLSDVMTCGRCGFKIRSKEDRGFLRLKCSECGLGASAPRVEETVEHWLLERFGRIPIEIPAVHSTVDSSAAERSRLEEARTTLENDRYVHGLFSGDSGTERFVRLATEIEAAIAALPAPEPLTLETELISAGTFADDWSVANNEDRREWARRLTSRIILNVSTTGTRWDPSRVEVSAFGPEVDESLVD